MVGGTGRTRARRPCLQVGLLGDGRPLCKLHDQAQGLLQARHHPHQVLLRHCTDARQYTADGAGGGKRGPAVVLAPPGMQPRAWLCPWQQRGGQSEQGWRQGGVPQEAAAPSRVHAVLPCIRRSTQGARRPQAAPEKATAISSRLCPSGERSLTKILTATWCPCQKPRKTSPEAPSPAGSRAGEQGLWENVGSS